VRAGGRRSFTAKPSGFAPGFSRCWKFSGQRGAMARSRSSRRFARNAATSNRLAATPKRSLKHREKSDDDPKPHASAMSVSDGRRRVAHFCRDIHTTDRSSRTRFTNSLSDSPTISRKIRWK
jgi:hypothetical protein